jgi:hypothetical protein
MQGFGTLLCALVLVSVSYTLNDNYDAMWRIALAMGGLPMAIAFYFRWQMHESESWEQKTKVIKYFISIRFICVELIYKIEYPNQFFQS